MLRNVLVYTIIAMLFLVVVAPVTIGHYNAGAGLGGSALLKTSGDFAMNTVEIYREFMQREPGKTYKIKLPAGIKCPRSFADLGRIAGISGRVGSAGNYYPAITEFREFPRVQLLASERGKLYIYDPKGELFDLCSVEVIAYETRKGTARGATIYVHDFKYPLPKLHVLPRAQGQLARLEGGRYVIDERGIVG